MAPLNDEHDYYKKMFELQEKLRKSEEKRIRLEEQFNALVRESHNRHEACINRLRMRYIQYLEEQRMRDERNHKLLAALDKVTNKLAVISAKKDRLNVLRKQYEAYLLRIYSNDRLPDSVAGDSGIASQNEKRRGRTVAAERANSASAETRSVSSPHTYQAAFQLSQPGSTYPPKIYDPAKSTSLNNSAASSATPVDVPLLDYHHRTGVVRESRVYTSPTAASYRSAFGDLQQDPWNFRVPHTTASLSMPPKPQFLVDTVGRSFKDHHARLLQTTPDSSTIAWLPTGDAARYERRRYSSPIESAGHFNPALTTSQPSQYREANLLLYNRQSRVTESIPDATESLPTKSSARSNVIDRPRSLFGDIDRTQRSANDGASTHSLASDDELIKRNERFLWNADEIASRQPSTVLDTSNLDDNDRAATTILENELDKYISNIRKLHGEHGVPSQDELDYEQNTSGDLLNATLSEDILEFPTVEDRAKKERMPEEMARFPASANDLALRTAADSGEIAFQIGRNGNSSIEIEDAIRQRTADTGNTELKLESRRDEAEGSSVFTTRGEIEERNRGDVATYSSELRQPREDADIANGNNINDLFPESRECGGETSTRYDAKEVAAASSNNKLATSDEGKNASRKKQPVVVENLGEESIVENLFDTAEGLAPWDLANVQKRVRQLTREARGTADNKLGEEITSESRASARFTERRTEDGEENNYDLSRDLTLSPSKAQTKRSDADKAEHDEEIETRACSEVVESFQVSDGKSREREVNELVDVAPRVDAEFSKGDESDERKDKSEMSEARIDAHPAESVVERGNEQEYTEHNRTQRYGEQDPNEQYDYGQNLSYEDAANEEYEKYADQGYARENQEYVEYVDSQYERYVEDPNNQQYQRDLGAQYQQGSDQAYDYSYDQRYNANQGYDDPNQMYEYAENIPYDPSETYQEECKGEERQPDDDIVQGEDCEGKLPETKETSSEKRLDEISEHKVNEDGDRDNLQQVSAINGTNRSKRNTDVIKSLLDSDTDTTIERNVSNAESDDFDFN